MGLELVIGLGITAFLLFYFSGLINNDKDKDSEGIGHGLLRLLSIFFALSLLLLVPKAAMDSQTTCESVIANETASGNLTTYEYDTRCYDREEGTSTIFLKIILWFQRLFIAYIVIYLMYLSIMALKNSITGRK